jgi:hypothetical protein
MRIFIVCDVLETNTEAMLSQWGTIFFPAASRDRHTALPPPALLRTSGAPSFAASHTVRKRAAVVAVAFAQPSFESGYLVQTCDGPTSFAHEDLAALKVAIEYLTALEGDFWIKIRGKGHCEPSPSRPHSLPSSYSLWFRSSGFQRRILHATPPPPVGLSYSYDISIHADEGLLRFSLSKSTNILEAYKEAHNIIQVLNDAVTATVSVLCFVWD